MARSACSSWMTEVYVSAVMVMEEWPRVFWMVFMSAPGTRVARGRPSSTVRQRCFRRINGNQREGLNPHRAATVEKGELHADLLL